MKKMVCEVCGGTELVKQNGVFVCQVCGAMYSMEDVKNLLTDVEGGEVNSVAAPAATAAPAGGVQVENLLSLAKSSFDSKNYAQAENFCNQIIAIDSKCFEAWKLKGEAINYQITSSNPRMTEVFNCIMTAYRVLPEDKKEEHKYEILITVKNCIEGEVDFWLDQFESGRPTTAALKKVKNAFIESRKMIKEAFSETGSSQGGETYLVEFTNDFIRNVNIKCVSTWESTVGYNYYRKSLDENNSIEDDDTNILWMDDEYRPNSDTFSTFIDECDNLIELIQFAEGYINDNTPKETVKTMFENLIFLEKHLIRGRSYKRMVKTTTNGYGAVTDKKEYWDYDKNLTSEAVSIRKGIIEEYKNKIVALFPEYGEELAKKERLKELETSIASLKREIGGLATERKAISGGGGAALLAFACIMFICGAAADMAWAYIVGIIEVPIGLLLLMKIPKASVVAENIKKKEMLEKQLAVLQNEKQMLENS